MGDGSNKVKLKVKGIILGYLQAEREQLCGLLI